MTAMDTASTLPRGVNSAADMCVLAKATTEPPSPANTPAVAYEPSLTIVARVRSARAASSLSRTARSWCPKRDLRAAAAPAAANKKTTRAT